MSEKNYDYIVEFQNKFGIWKEHSRKQAIDRANIQAILLNSNNNVRVRVLGFCRSFLWDSKDGLPQLSKEKQKELIR